MPTPSSGPINAEHINTELGNPVTSTLGLNDTAVRGLAGAPFSQSGSQISYNDLRGKSASVSATGGNIVKESGGSKYHLFYTSGSFVVSGAGDIEMIVVASGGGGGGVNDAVGGGGGAGRVKYYPSKNIDAGTYPIQIGTGGNGGGGGSNGTKGGDTNFGPGTPFPVPTNGGGGGGGAQRNGTRNSGQPGGSGGSGCGWDSPKPGGSAIDTPSPIPGVISYGNAGKGSGYGGGGALASGDPHHGAEPVFGGIDGQPFPGFAGPTFSPSPAMPADWIQAVQPTGYYGGGGSTSGDNGTDATGGYAGPEYGGGWGGGGSGGPPGGPAQGDGIPGVNATGGGGGGAWSGGNNASGQKGGNGIVIIKYPV